MTQAEFNKALQTVQGIELFKGFAILTPTVFRDNTGQISEAVWYDADGCRVFTQRRPFMPEVEYIIHEDRYGRIVYADYWC